MTAPIHTNRTRQEGEMLVRRMDKRAFDFYSGTDSYVIYANDRTDDDGIHVSQDYGQSFSLYTFAELEQELIDLSEEEI